ncbi:peptidase S8/S53 domain-containing protein [Microdochium trichocladiopsis]|uniref:Peptidase S8/S53 domain-containing protein n=1 Tax=Microdochium trichocladiopsis TaxID=1682393 RepID=A0A9P8Y1T5_9PEZI|nr:peptidase S8/S53 domain-containing protein [Microdochium trichocladiopsis]KAH7027647.1 peptidase S8/S53 domain-containing protein [Microdochium trichocladiopsis]
MRLATLVGLAAGSLAGLGSANLAPRNYDANDYYVLQLERGVNPDDVAARLDMRHEGPLGNLAGHHMFSAVKRNDDIVSRAVHERRRRRTSTPDLIDRVPFWQKQRLRAPMTKRSSPGPARGAFPAEKRQDVDAQAVQRQKNVMSELGITDPIFTEQWHLFNAVEVGHDVNVTDVWRAGITGHNSTVAIVDDGLDMYSNDLKPNYYAAGSYDFNDHRPEPKPTLSDDRHGTRCAGEIGAAKNDVCGVGVAYDSKIAGIRILSKLITESDEALSLNYDFQHNQIYSCSWGPPDDGKSMEAPGILIKRAMLNGVQNGRSGKGSVFVFASGNGAVYEDNCNFDGYTNSIYSITVGAVDRKGLHPYYSEKCSAQLVVTYSSGSGDAIHTTDVGENTCSSSHGGTSAAAPLAAGIFALALEVRPDLTWRDMQYIALQTAVVVDPSDEELQTTATGKQFSHTFGYGKLDSWALVEAARTWKNVKPQAWLFSPWIHIKHDIPQGDKGLTSSFTVTKDMMLKANLARLEHVTVTMNVEHSKRGDLSVDLISPSGLVSHIATTRKGDLSGDGYADWTFMSVVHWGEDGVGDWKIIVKDSQVNENSGKWVDWHLKLWGESIDAEKATLLPMPTEEDDDNHDENIPVTTGVAETTTLPPAVQQTPSELPSVPSDHPERPTKPGSGSTAEGSAGEKPSETEGGSGSSSSDSSAAETTTAESSWLPSFLPTFGVSSRTQAWIYGAFSLIVVFCAGLGAWLYMQRRKRLSNTRDNYEFELINEEEGEGLTGAGAAAGEKGRKRRGGELYDAFADGSDDEMEMFSDGDDDDDSQGRRAGGSSSAAAAGSAAAAASSSSRAGPASDEDDDSEEDSVDEKAGLRGGTRR